MSTVVFQLDGSPVTVGVEDGVAPSVAALFPALRVPGVEAEGRLPLDFEVSRRPGVFSLRESGGDWADHERLPDLLTVLEFRLLERMLEPLDHLVHLHGSGVVAQGHALLALGPSGAGKSSLALAWAMAGHPVLGDDLLLLEADARIRGFPRLAKIHRERLILHGLTEGDTLAPLDDHPETWFDLHRSRPWPPEPHPVAVVAQVTYDPRCSESSVTREYDPPHALHMILQHRLSSGLQLPSALDPVIALAESAHTVDVRFREATECAAFLLDLLADGSSG